MSEQPAVPDSGPSQLQKRVTTAHAPIPIVLPFENLSNLPVNYSSIQAMPVLEGNSTSAIPQFASPNPTVSISEPSAFRSYAQPNKRRQGSPAGRFQCGLPHIIFQGYEETAHFRVRVLAALLFILSVAGSGYALATEENPVTAELRTSKYRIIGYRSGNLVIEDPEKQESITQLQLEPRAVRGIFLFDQNTIAISQITMTTFFDLSERKPVHALDEYMIGVSDNKAIFFTHHEEMGSMMLSFYRYPSMEAFCGWKNNSSDGVGYFRFSQDGHYIIIRFDPRYPIPDRHYPIDPNFLETLRTTRPVFHLLCLLTCERIDEFSTVSFTFPGRFSEGGDSYELVNPGIHRGGKPYDMGKRFNLEKRTWEMNESQAD